MTVGDIHWVQLPAPNGREQGGRRPAVILQDDHYAGGLPQASVALVFQLRAIDRHRVQERIGSVSEAVLHAMLAELDKLTGRAG